MTTRLVDRVRNVLDAESWRPESVSEILLGFSTVSYEQLYNALSEAGFDIDLDQESGTQTLRPFELKRGKRYVLAVRTRTPDPPIRANVLGRMSKQYDSRTLDTWLWPPTGGFGEWDFRKRKFSSVYEQRSKEYNAKLIPSHLKRKYGITDKVYLDRAIQEGLILRIESTPIDVSPDGHNRLDTRPLKSPMELPQLHVLYRGTTHFQNHPLMPGLYRKLGMAQNVSRITSFTINLILETIADEFDMMLTYNEAGSIIQHYKILPWTNMIDLTRDINIAKAFASANKSSDIHPHLYQVVVWNLDMFDTGSKLMDKLRFARPRRQKAVSHFGLKPKVDSHNMVDQYSLLVSVTEHPFERDNWKRFGGPSFRIRDAKFPSPFLNKEADLRLAALLYPAEDDPRAIRVLLRVIQTLEKNLNWFAELGEEVDNVGETLQELRSSLKGTEADSKKRQLHI